MTEQNFDLIYTKDGKARVVIDMPYPIEIDIERWRKSEQEFENEIAEEEGIPPRDYSKVVPTAADIIQSDVDGWKVDAKDWVWEKGEDLANYLSALAEKLRSENESKVTEENAT